MPPLPEPPPALPSNNAGAQIPKTVNLCAWYTYSHTCPSCGEQFTHNAHAQDNLYDTGWNPDMLTDTETFTG
jgi:hypothetical protein